MRNLPSYWYIVFYWVIMQSATGYCSMVSCHHDKHKEIDVLFLLQTYDEIQKLPILEMLNLLDDVVTQFDQFAVDYEINSRLTWRKWLVKYWWSIPAMCGKLIFLCLTHARTLGFLKQNKTELHRLYPCVRLSISK